jgi:hypothetical protein
MYEVTHHYNWLHFFDLKCPGFFVSVIRSKKKFLFQGSRLMWEIIEQLVSRRL